MRVKQLISKQKKSQEELFTEDLLTAACNKKKTREKLKENIFQIINVHDDVLSIIFPDFYNY